ncbi:DUF3173 family protein [Lactococcus garvieae]|uniref:DUF3173 family protein n=1 Tax=Lactococcus garvieae TaxID=1363 RepID=UPI0030D2CFFC
MENTDMISKNYLIEKYNLKNRTATMAIRTAKETLVKQGYSFYDNKYVTCVPKKIIAEMLNLEV